MEFYEVGGCVRDEIMGVKSKDIDFTVVLDEDEVTPRRTKIGKLLDRTPFEVMEDELNRRGFEIFVRSPQYLTIRARFPRMWDPRLMRREYRGMTADFVLARKEGDYTDGRRPDVVEPGTLEDDLRRRDFTMNAIAKDRDGNFIDLFGGQEDIQRGVIRCVGSAEARIREDSLRALRALRFAVTKGFVLDDELWVVMRSDWLPGALASVSVERKEQELRKAFQHNTLETLFCLNQLSAPFREAVFTDGLRLMPTLRGA